MKVEVKQGRRYAAGIVVPFWLPDTVIGTELMKSDQLGFTNAISYKRSEVPFSTPKGGSYTDVVVATRSGPTAVIDTDLPPYKGVVEWIADAYPDMVMPGEQPNENQVATGGDLSTVTYAAGGLVLASLLGIFFLSNYVRL